MRLRILLLGLLGSILPFAVGCSNSTTADAEKPANISVPIDNNSAAARNAPGAPAPDSGLPPPGGPKRGVKK